MSELVLTASIAVASAQYWIDRPYDYLLPEKLREEAACGKRVIVPFGAGNRRCEGIILSLGEKTPERSLKFVDSILDAEPVLSEEMLRLALWMRERFFCTVYDAVRAMLPAGLWYCTEAVYTLSPEYDAEKALVACGRSKQEKLALDAVLCHGGRCPLSDLETVFGESDPARALSSLVKKGVLLTESKEKRRVGDKTKNIAALTIAAEEARTLAEQKRRKAPKQAAILELLCSMERISVRELLFFTGASASVLKALVTAGCVEISESESFRRPSYETAPSAPLPVLNESQNAAYEGLLSMAAEHRASGALLYGVTGSGKTAVYVHLIRALLREGRSSILLVPEISLTPQMLRTFSAYFGDNIAVLHSSLTVGERYDEWKRVKSGLARVVIGTRSAVFAPVRSLGLIIIDEEQEHTYKSENSPRYHARDVAKFRCGQSGALLVQGSATPDVETTYAARNGKLGLFTMSGRFNRRALPEVRIVDMKRELKNGNGSGVSEELRREIESNLERGEQSILFLNRRGASSLINCRECGYTFTCPNCSVSLTWHSDTRRLVCHYCGHTERLPAACPDCGGELNFVGIGTQKLAEQLRERFPDIEILRMDADTVSPAGSHESILSRFREQRVPILIGTQMVTKGLDFPNVTLVGVISADQSLYCGSYRASERTFSLITQVVGRSGRGDKPGRAIIQTYTPQNQVIRQAAAQDYDAFYRSEIELRSVSLTPPFAETVSITVTGLTEAEVLQCCSYIRRVAKEELAGRDDVRILGPAPLPVLRVNRRFRYHVTFAGRIDRELRRLVSGILIYCNTEKEFKGVSVFADMNPME